MNKWYSLDRIKTYKVPYRIIIGERSNGKTYSVKRECIDKYAYNGGKFMYIRRRHEQITRKLMSKLFNDIGEVAIDTIGDYIHYGNEKGFYILDSDNNEHTIGYCTSIEDCYTLKGIPFNEITTIFFDEFLEYGNPIEDEIAKFLNVISTICRKRTDVEIYMVANTITRYSDYFNLFGIDPKKLKMGTIAYLKHESGVECAIEYCNSNNIIDGIKQKNQYIGFDNNPTSNMILYGEWEYSVCNTANIDGIGWNSEKKLLPIYITAIGEVYQLALYLGDEPIAFVRKINTQDGKVREEIKYNLSYDSSLFLTTKNGIVPMYGRLIDGLIEKNIYHEWVIFIKCIQAKRVVYDSIATGSDFNKIIKEVM